MNEFKMSDEQLGMLLFKAMHEPRRNQKRWIRDCGGVASAEELDRLLVVANASKKAVGLLDSLEAKRKIQSSGIESSMDANVRCMMDELVSAMESAGIKQSDMAIACGISQPIISQYLSCKQQPGIRNLVKMADSLGLKWKLVKK
jgi:predicted XRE-type DNA-binding protein